MPTYITFYHHVPEKQALCSCKNGEQRKNDVSADFCVIFL